MKAYWGHPTARLVGQAAGIMGCLVMYGVLQERIMTVSYSGDGGLPRDAVVDERPVVMGPGAGREGSDYFTCTALLVLSNRLIACLVALALSVLNDRQQKSADVMRGLRAALCATQAREHWRGLLGVSLTNIAATLCQYEALKHVSFVMQTLGKTAKMIPVMVYGALLQRKRYSRREVAGNGLITLGCTVFVLSGGGGHGHGAAKSSTAVGLLLMLGFLWADGLTGLLQEMMLPRGGGATTDGLASGAVGQQKAAMSKWAQMLWVNAISSVISLGIVLWSGEMLKVAKFARAHPRVLGDSTVLSLTAALGQVCIYSVIAERGALVLSGIMVTRQVVSVVVSCLVFGHTMTILQVLAAITVFATLVHLEAFLKKNHRHGPTPLPQTVKN